jgi:membrane fusion protein (multidrug efflux system)
MERPARLKYAKWIIAALVLVCLAVGAYFYWRHTIEYPSTSDAYVAGNVVRIAPRVGGRITRLPVHDHEHVKKGELLVQLDPAPFQVDLDHAQANLKLAREQLQAASSSVKAAQALVDQRKAQLKNADDNAKRMQRLFSQHAVSKSSLDDAVTARDSAHAALLQAQADLKKAIREQAAAGSEASVRVARAAVEKARLDLSYTRIVAPVSGVLGKISVRPADIVNQGQALFPLVEDNSFWISANFKETDLDRIRPGEPVTISVDMYPGVTYHGTVDSVSPASGVAFSLLPPENATGNWVKITQRFPVKITIDDKHPGRPLRIGATANVTVDTTGKGQAND